jgi:DNA-binding NarL/FixJ family response regulator
LGVWLLRCLIVDDNEEFLASASRLLTSQGLQLGNEDGLEVTRRLAGNDRATHVILISTHSADDLAELIADSPAVGFLPKAALGARAITELLG